MSLDAAARFATDPDLAGPLTVALVAVAHEVLDEPADVADHDRRVQLAREVLRAPEQVTNRFAWAVGAAYPELVASWHDFGSAFDRRDLLPAVRARWSTLAVTAG